MEIGVFGKKDLRKISIIILVIFGITVVVFPLIYSPVDNEATEEPVQMELNE